MAKEIIQGRNVDPLLRIWGQRIADTRKLRNKHGEIRRRGQDHMSQTDLAALTGVQQATVSRWESGLMEPTRSKKQQIADALGVPASAIFALPMDGAA